MGTAERFNPLARKTNIASPSVVNDRFGRALHEGDQVMLTLPAAILFTVRSITPNLDPAAPSNLMKITVSASLGFAAQAGAPNVEFTRVVTAEEIAAARPDSHETPA